MNCRVSRVEAGSWLVFRQEIVVCTGVVAVAVQKGGQIQAIFYR